MTERKPAPARPTGGEDGPSGFFSRWSRRKAQVARGQALPEPADPGHWTPTPAPLPGGLAGSAAAAATAAPTSASAAPADTAPAEPAPTLDDVAQLDIGADVRRFVAPGVDRVVANAALKRLFADPHFNVMDGLDTYIEDYGLPDPLPAGMLEQMSGSRFMGFFPETQEAPVEPGADAMACLDTDAAAAAAGGGPELSAEAPLDDAGAATMLPGHAPVPGSAAALLPEAPLPDTDRTA